MAEQSKPWTTLQEPNEDIWEQRTFLFYGPSGVGKTRLSSMFPKPLLLSCDPGQSGGSASARRGIQQIKIFDYQQIMDLMPQLQESAGIDFYTLIVDSATYLGRITMQHILTSVGREVPRFDEFNLNFARMSMLIQSFADLPCHVIFTAIDKYDKDEVTGKLLGGPDLVGQLRRAMPQAVDVCCRLFTNTAYGSNGKLSTQYKFRSVPDDLFFCKDRFSVLPSEGESEFEVFAPLFSEKELLWEQEQLAVETAATNKKGAKK